jgi:DNA-binding MarR family transcriptional regulator
MEDLENPIAQKLLKSFSQFRKTGWHEKQIAGLNPSDIKVLFAIKHSAVEGKTDIKVSEISSILHVTAPTVTQIINKLEKDGLVIRNIDPADRRAVNIRLTEKGLEITNQARKIFLESFTGLVEFLGEEDSEKLAELLTKVFHYFQNYDR